MMRVVFLFSLLFVVACVARTYEVRYYNVNATVESNRLLAQVDMFWKSERQGLLALGLGAASANAGARVRILELACGPAHFSERVLREFSAADITCVELDDDFIKLGQERLEQRLGAAVVRQRFRYVKGDANKIAELAELQTHGPFDLVLCRLILQHLPGAQEQVIKSLVNVLAPGGFFVAIDADGSMPDYYQPALPMVEKLGAKAHKWRKEYRKSPPPDETLGRRSFWVFERCGLLYTECNVLMASSVQFGNQVVRNVLDPTQYEVLIKHGLATEYDIQAATRELHNAFPLSELPTTPDNERSLMLSYLYFCAARKAAASSNSNPAPRVVAAAEKPASAPLLNEFKADAAHQQQQQQQQQPQHAEVKTASETAPAEAAAPFHRVVFAPDIKHDRLEGEQQQHAAEAAAAQQHAAEAAQHQHDVEVAAANAQQHAQHPDAAAVQHVVAAEHAEHAATADQQHPAAEHHGADGQSQHADQQHAGGAAGAEHSAEQQHAAAGTEQYAAAGTEQHAAAGTEQHAAAGAEHHADQQQHAGAEQHADQQHPAPAAGAEQHPVDQHAAAGHPDNLPHNIPSDHHDQHEQAAHPAEGAAANHAEAAPQHGAEGHDAGAAQHQEQPQHAAVESSDHFQGENRFSVGTPQTNRFSVGTPRQEVQTAQMIPYAAGHAQDPNVPMAIIDGPLLKNENKFLG